MPIHEFGHAVASWLCSRPALPIVFGGFTFISAEQSMLLKIGLMFFFVYGLFHAYRSDFKWRFILLLALFFTFMYGSFKASALDTEKIILLAGQFFEITLPALLVSFYFVNFIEIERWSFWRLISLIYGLPAFLLSIFFWYNVFMSNQNLPFGSALSSDGMASKDGDLNRLVALGLTESAIAHIYLIALTASIAAVVISGVVYLLKSEDFSN